MLFKKHTDDDVRKKERVALITIISLILVLFFFSSCSNIEYAYYEKNWIEHQTHLEEEPKIECDFCMNRCPYIVN